MKMKSAVLLVFAASLLISGCTGDQAGFIDDQTEAPDEVQEIDPNAGEPTLEPSNEENQGAGEKNVEPEAPIVRDLPIPPLKLPPKIIKDSGDIGKPDDGGAKDVPVIKPAQMEEPGQQLAFESRVDVLQPGKKAHKAKVTFWTGDRKKGGTDEFIAIKFCKERNLLRSSAIFTKDICKMFMSKSTGFEKGDVDEYEFDQSTRAPYSLDQLPFIRVGVVENNKSSYGDDADKDWFLQGLKVELIYDDGASVVTYWNPCINRWLSSARGWEIDLGPDDTAFCTVIKTCDVDKAGTDDIIGLAFKGAPDASFIQFHYQYYDDFEKGDETAYGQIFFGYDPFTSFGSHEFRLTKAEDGKKGGWCLGNIKLYAFSPAKSFRPYSNIPSSFYEASYTPGDNDKWLADDDLTTDWIKLKPVDKLPSGWETIGSIH